MVSLSTSLIAQKNNTHSKIPQPHNHNGVVCGIGEPKPGFVIPAPPMSKNPSQNTAIFEVTFTDNVPNVARTSFLRATDIMSTFFNSSIPITVSVEASADLAPGTLAGASPGGYLRDFSNAPVINAWYPIALAEKLEQTDFNENSVTVPFDITVTYNSTVNWNFVSTNVGANQFDFITVILHELMHGLGFVSLSTVTDAGLGDFLVLGDFPSAYSTFLEDGNGLNLVENFTSPSLALGNQLTSNDVLINTETLGAQNQIAQIFSPSPFNPGSSTSHLDQFTFTNTPHELMRPGISPGAIIHNPGSIALDILYDLGWRKTSIAHEPGPITDDVTMPYVVDAVVLADIGFDPSSFVIHFSQDTFTTEMVAPMTPTGNAGEFTVTLPAPGEISSYQYFFTLNNGLAQQVTTPTAAPGANFFEFFYDVDEILPEIEHQPVTTLDDKSTELLIEANISDVFTGVNDAFIEYSINDVPQGTVPMERDFTNGFRPDLFVGIINLPENGLNEGDRLEYQIFANDNSAASNLITSPAADETYEVIVSKILDAISFYVSDFEIDDNEFNGNGFSITSPNGFSDQAIHSTHPYPNAGAENTLDFLFNLRIPIIIRRTDALIEFDEIVLVEPGDPGTQFGDTEFWDFVIVEGRNSNSSEWLPFLDGYDSTDDPAWFNTYVNGIPQGSFNSLAAGTPNLFRNRTIDMQENGNFVEGDTVLIRFRLFSDPAAIGWGWAVDNLSIQDSPVAVEDFLNQQDFSIYPNPVGKGILAVEAQFKQTVDEATLKLSNINGQTIQQQSLEVNNQILRASFDVESLPKGVYLITMDLDGKEQITRRIVKQ